MASRITITPKVAMNIIVQRYCNFVVLCAIAIGIMVKHSGAGVQVSGDIEEKVSANMRAVPVAWFTSTFAKLLVLVLVELLALLVLVELLVLVGVLAWVTECGLENGSPVSRAWTFIVLTACARVRNALSGGSANAIRRHHHGENFIV
jgi:hypothetical protein